MAKNKRNKAVALKYTPETDSAPVVIASGYGKVADKIIDIAEQNGIPVFRDDSTASLLCMLEVGNAIPPELYEVIAAIYVQLVKASAEIKQATKENIYSRLKLDRFKTDSENNDL
ncbi:MAG: EscU/YscU/HrcU family type III secretion system export apparatus switch protein [Oscillospiraceae bacterium]|jgi:flagellar biosynthesis protein|nr:EscU/YscU/HrcU family type III secretion system export apparatus switch protein [Oscillospiraceae bacterium]